MLRQTVNISTSLELSVWYSSSNPSFNIQCYLWSTPDGSLPSTPALPQASADLIQELLNSTSVVKEVVLDHADSCTLGTTSIYSITSSRDSDEPSSSPGMYEHIFEYHRSKTCNGNLVCTQLSLNICGDYGLRLTVENGGNSSQSDICTTGLKQGIALSQDDRVQLDLWFTGNGGYDLQCFLWCSEDGSLPGPSGETGVGVDLEESLVGASESSRRPSHLKSQFMFQLNGTAGITEVSLDSNDDEEVSRRQLEYSGNVEAVLAV